jgi:hypothetical protein
MLYLPLYLLYLYLLLLL